jgi:hypothetical protein
MPKYTVEPGTNITDAMTEFDTNVKVSYSNRATDYLKEFYPALSYDPKKPPELEPDDGKGATIEGMPIGVFEDDLTVQLWRPVTIRGYTFNVGDNVTVNRTKVTTTPPEGGDFAWLYATYQAEKSGTDFATYWNRLPPPLIREGTKVQTPWLTAFLKDPYPIRPAAQLRMPRFHYSKLDDVSPHDTRELANYFPASDGADFPYQPIPEREQDYLTKLEKQHPDYLGAGWQLMTKGACVQCHAIGQYQPTGGAEVVNGPDMRQVSPRFRPGYLAEWLANPRRLIPYTAMPQNIPPHGPPPPAVPKTFEDRPLEMVKAMRDTLLNYVSAIEGQLASAQPGASKPEADPSKPQAPQTEATKASGGAR